MKDAADKPTPTLTDRQFHTLSAIARRRWGLDMPNAKRGLVSARASRLMRRLGYASLDQLCEELDAPESSIDPLQLFDVLSTNHTSFFREPEHFRVLVREIIQPAVDQGKREVKLWSAGCSNGAEPYTMSIAAREAEVGGHAPNLRILATDLSLSILARAKRAVYPVTALKDLEPGLIARHFQPESVNGADAREYAVREHVKAPVTFALLNLLEPWSMRGPFDAIFCRNVMIYFDGPTKHALVDRFVQLIRPGGLFFVGGSETLNNSLRPDLENVQANVYRKRLGAKT